MQPGYAGREDDRAEVQDRTVPWMSRKEQPHAAFTRHQPLELQLLQAPAEQLARIIHLVTGASGYPAEQERPAKKHRFHLPACLCSLPGSVLPRREAASNLPGRSQRKSSATFIAAACKPDNKLEGSPPGLEISGLAPSEGICETQ